MEGIYGSGKYCPHEGDCLDLDQLSNILRTSTDPGKLLDAWREWHTISPPIKPLFQRYVELGNKGARELGFADMGVMWRSNYDMPAGCRVPVEMDRLWEQVKPLLSFSALLRAFEATEKNMATWFRRTAPFRRICSAICGRRVGRTSTR